MRKKDYEDIAVAVKLAQLTRKNAAPKWVSDFFRKMTKDPTKIKALQDYIKDSVLRSGSWKPQVRLKALDNAIKETAEAVDKGQAKPDLLASLFRERDTLTFLTDRSLGTEFMDVGSRIVREHPFLTGAAATGAALPLLEALRGED